MSGDKKGQVKQNNIYNLTEKKEASIEAIKKLLEKFEEKIRKDHNFSEENISIIISNTKNKLNKIENNKLKTFMQKIQEEKEKIEANDKKKLENLEEKIRKDYKFSEENISIRIQNLKNKLNKERIVKLKTFIKNNTDKNKFIYNHNTFTRIFNKINENNNMYANPGNNLSNRENINVLLERLNYLKKNALKKYKNDLNKKRENIALTNTQYNKELSRFKEIISKLTINDLQKYIKK